MKLNNMKIAVTGSSGFIGSHLVKKLLENKARIVCLDLKDGINIEDWNQIKKIEKFDLMFHLASKTFVPYSYNNPRDFYVSNIISTLNTLELSRIHKAKMIYVSSYVYGKPKILPINEHHEVSAFNPYSQGKIICENLCQGYNRDFGLKVIILRPFNVYGILQKPEFLIPSIINQIKTGKVVLKDPTPKRDFVYIDDVVSALIKCIYFKNYEVEIFNIGSGQSHSIQEIVNCITEDINFPIEVLFTGEKRKNEIQDTVADISKAKKVLNWIPEISLNEGIKKVLKYKYNNYGKETKDR